ncbi:MAG: DUF4912 domain-containing protein [Elusimicrobia bacterium]|nr:DUF4912 domain-containing protein [Elusimicrobiota bacterium]
MSSPQAHRNGHWEAVALTPGAPLPDTYGEDVLVLLPRDPHWMFAYWELTEALWQECALRWGAEIVQHSERVLRVHAVTENRFFDITITPVANNWYIQVDQPGRSYCVELGLKTADGRFFCLLRSNVVHLPLGQVSDVVDERWMSIDQETFEKLLERFRTHRVKAGSVEWAQHLVQRLLQRWERLQVGFSWPGGRREPAVMAK